MIIDDILLDKHKTLYLLNPVDYCWYTNKPAHWPLAITFCSNFAVYGQVLPTAIRLYLKWCDSFRRFTEKEDKRLNSSLVYRTTLRISAASEVRNARVDYFLNFSSLTGTPEGHGSFSRGSRHRVRDAEIFFAGSFRRTFCRAMRRRGGR